MARLSAVDLLPDVFEVEDQGTLGSCTANAGCSALELMYKRAGQPVDLSRLYLYYWERREHGLVGDVGAMPSQITEQLKRRGTCLESTWPYDPALLDVQPPPEADAEAAGFRILGDDFIQLAIADLDTIIERIRASLCAGIPVLQTSMITQSFMRLRDQRDWRTNSFSMATDETNQVLGLHETLIIGFDDAAQMFLCQNSWGPAWGDGGFFGVPYRYMGNAWISQLWFITDAGVRAIPVPGAVPDVVPEVAPTPAPITPPPEPPPIVTPEPVIPHPTPFHQDQTDNKATAVVIALAVLAVVLALAHFL